MNPVEPGGCVVTLRAMAALASGFGSAGHWLTALPSFHSCLSHSLDSPGHFPSPLRLGHGATGLNLARY